MRYRVLPTAFAFGPVMPMCALPGVTGALPADDRRVRIPWTLPGITDAIPEPERVASRCVTGGYRMPLGLAGNDRGCITFSYPRVTSGRSTGAHASVVTGHYRWQLVMRWRIVTE